MLSIFFAGSMDLNDPRRAAFTQFCETLGQRVAERHRVLVAGTVERNADYSIAMGAFRQLETEGRPSKGPRIVLYQTHGDATEEANNALFQKFKSADRKVAHIDESDKTRGYDIAFFKAIEACDVVVVIGGGTNTREIVDLATHHRKPVLGFDQFGGAGEAANRQLQRVYELFKIDDLAAGTLTRADMDAEGFAKFNELVTAAYRKNPWGLRQLPRRLAGYAVAFTVALAIWGWATIEAIDNQPFFLSHFNWAYVACPFAGIAGGLLMFFGSIRAPSDISHASAWHKAIRGGFSGITIVLFVNLVMLLIYRGEGETHEIAFGPLYGLCSFFSAAAGALGIRSLEALEQLLHLVAHGSGRHG